jgi:3-hydroxybutyryl-CoA dehydratase
MTILTRQTTVGSEFSGKKSTLTWERLWAFSGGLFAADGWPKKNIHTDMGAAKATGLYTVAASGTQYQGYAVSLLIDLFGEQWLGNGSMTAKFIAVVTVNDTIQPKAKVVAVRTEQGRSLFELELWCENQNGTKVMVGTAVGSIA